MSPALRRVIDALEAHGCAPKRSGSEWSARCPGHEDTAPSLSIGEGDDGRVLVNCHRGCELAAILGPLGLVARDLFPPNSNGNAKQIVAAYPYRDQSGVLLYEVVRTEPKSFFQRRPDGNGGWVNGTDGVRRVLYRLPELIEALLSRQDDEAMIYIVEGEKDADRLWGEGLIATTNVGGAGKWKPAYTTQLVEAGVHRVVVIPDNDKPGAAHADAIARSCIDAELETRVLRLPGLPPVREKHGEDVSDWLDAGRTLEELLAAVREAPTYVSLPAQDANADEAEAWPAPVPLAEHELPTFPVDALPAWLREFVEAEAHSTQTPVELPAAIVLAVCATACAGKFRVEVRPDYSEPLNLYTVVALDSGERKSAVVRDVIAPIEEFERSEAQRMKPEIATALSRREIAEVALKEAQRAAAKAKPEHAAELAEKANDLARELDAMEIPAAPRLLADDCSPEKLTNLLAMHSGKMAILSPEGDVFDMMAGRYSKDGGPNLGVYLKAHAGDSIRVDRVGRSADYVEAPALTLGLAVQPEVIRTLSLKPGFKNRGLIARFLFFRPRSRLGRRETNPPPMPEAVRQAYRDRLTKMLSLPFATKEGGRPTSHVLRLDVAASDRLSEFAAWVEPKLGEFGELAGMSDWGGKLVGAVVRIAGRLHVAEHAEHTAPWGLPIPEATVESAIRIGKFLIPHAQAAHAEMGMDAAVADARYLLRWLTREKCSRFTKRELFEATKGRLCNVGRLDQALEVLEGHHIVRAAPQVARPGPGRPPSPGFEVNPEVRSQYSQNSQNPKEEATETNSANTANTFLKVNFESTPPLSTENQATNGAPQLDWFEGDIVRVDEPDGRGVQP